jgi:hypothetical protein
MVRRGRRFESAIDSTPAWRVEQPATPDPHKGATAKRQLSAAATGGAVAGLDNIGWSLCACVLLCGHIGALALLELSDTGPLARRPRLAACEGARLHRERPGRA